MTAIPLGEFNVTPEQVEMIAERIAERIAKETVKETMLQLGINADNAMDMQRDMQWLRTWREMMSQATTKGMMVLVGFLAAGLISAVIAGIRAALK